MWSFEWSINSNFDGSSGLNLNDLTYALSMTSTTGATIPAFDPINGLNPNPLVLDFQWDHAIGNNGNGNGGGTVIPNSVNNVAGYASLIDNNNLAQNSWKPSWVRLGVRSNGKRRLQLYPQRLQWRHPGCQHQHSSQCGAGTDDKIALVGLGLAQLLCGAASVLRLRPTRVLLLAPGRRTSGRRERVKPHYASN